MFENIKGFTSDTKLVSNVHGSWPNLALAMGMPKDTPLKTLSTEFNRRYQDFAKGSIEERDTAPWQDVVLDSYWFRSLSRPETRFTFWLEDETNRTRPDARPRVR